MTTPVVASSELEAVNFMLDTIGEAPVSSIEGSGLVDVKIAVNTLAMVSRQVQVEGWAFNTDFNYLLAKGAGSGLVLLHQFPRGGELFTVKLQLRCKLKHMGWTGVAVELGRLGISHAGARLQAGHIVCRK